MTVRVLGPAVASLWLASGLWAQSVQSPRFPHARHEGLFPLCESCHSGIPEGREADYFPAPERCIRCHDGVTEERVDWSGPARPASNLDFHHQTHAADVVRSGGTVACADCHRPPGSVGRMAVARATPEGCLGCHAHEAPEHLADGRDCRGCHVPLTGATGLSAERIAAFPKPASHDREDFLRSHAPPTNLVLGACATCHAVESCTRCHMNGQDLPSIASLGSDARVASIVAAKAPEYPEPETHESLEWRWLHGEAALNDSQTCANCHSQDSCGVCHETARPQQVASLPAPPQDDPRGVRLSHEPLVHEVGFAFSHQAAATSNEGACRTCHTGSFCESCHDGPDKPSFHFGNFLQMHGPEAWGAETECATCHNPDVFCRGCHDALGRGSEGRLDVAYHSDRPFWLFGHGGAARQGLESCRTCHSQADCTQCHAAVGAWRVNPHGPGFDAERLADANPSMCLLCHRTGIPRP